jgi:hypothetical protein
MLVVEPTHGLEDVLAICPGVLVTQPVVDGETLGGQA